MENLEVSKDIIVVVISETCRYIECAEKCAKSRILSTSGFGKDSF